MGYLNKKFNYISKNILKKIFYIKINKYKKFEKSIVVHKKSSVVLKCFKNSRFSIHKGNIYRYLTVNKFCIGFSFASFVFTKKPHVFVKKKKKSKNIIRR